eukprot:TRINITY_DN18850_c0_g1_i1.p2 TRINITY_DN18850_c0_g1~~TRINITY_DN18850_c0_g1_i1.p2  ORF type:complete len:139 (+),score=49.16 TRINITY_DN18850_c0_g1_i1:28-444(+)
MSSDNKAELDLAGELVKFADCTKLHRKAISLKRLPLLVLAAAVVVALLYTGHTWSAALYTAVGLGFIALCVETVPVADDIKALSVPARASVGRRVAQALGLYNKAQCPAGDLAANFWWCDQSLAVRAVLANTPARLFV